MTPLTSSWAGVMFPVVGALSPPATRPLFAKSCSFIAASRMSSWPRTMNFPDCWSESVSISPHVSERLNWVPLYGAWFSNFETMMLNRRPPLATSAGAAGASARAGRGTAQVRTRARATSFFMGGPGWVLWGAQAFGSRDRPNGIPKPVVRSRNSAGLFQGLIARIRALWQGLPSGCRRALIRTSDKILLY
jgi:hypothetical protein